MKKDILYNAIKNVNELTSLKCEVVALDIIEGNSKYDALIQIKINKQVVKYYVEIKRKIVPAQIYMIKEQNKNVEHYIIITDYITTKAKELLRLNNIPYIETAGNMFLKNDYLYIHIETGKTNREKLKKGNRAFTKAGLKVVYQFLIKPETLNKPYRYTAEFAKVTIDTVRHVLLELLKEGYIIKINDKKYQFTDRKRLFNEWITGYNRTLKPDLKQGTYKFINKGTEFRQLDLPENTYWSGAVAAEIVTDYLIADTGILYTDLPFNDLMKKMKIIPDKKGNITLIEKFWKTDTEQEKFVNYILIYADLIDNTDPRYFETAEKIFIKYVQNYI